MSRCSYCGGKKVLPRTRQRCPHCFVDHMKYLEDYDDDFGEGGGDYGEFEELYAPGGTSEIDPLAPETGEEEDP